MSEPLKPDVGLLIKLGSIAVHVEELLSYAKIMPDNAVEADTAAIKSLLNDPELKEWIAGMDRMAFMPVKR